ncbi:ABC transporter substrate-binding protein [Aureimonas flava]|uniref:ABC transporter substrate-binding protein n=2 Tax=Aureimonas flava TaxID=2320271 RepID=A0A3A1WRT3_9HYPH|nr:ABC transporter substrate-binding protein [Aureimonas flava]
MSKWLHTAVPAVAVLLVASFPATAETLTVVTAGGEYGDAMRQAMWEPAAKELGFEVRAESQSDSLAALRMQVASGSVTADVIHLGSNEGAQAAALGLLEPLDASVVKQDEIPEGARSEYCVPFSSYGTVLAWNTKTYGDKAPKTWADFWNVEAFPGRRALRANAQDQIEIALLSEGVAPADVYQVLSTPEGLERAIKRIEELKPNVAIWWTSGAQSTQILKDGEVDMVVTWNGRAANAAADGGAAAYTFNQNIVGTDCFGVPKGAPHAAEAMKLIAAMTTGPREAAMATLISYGPVNKTAFEGGAIPAETLAKLATAPGNVENALFARADWWAENGQEAQVAFDEMMSR